MIFRYHASLQSLKVNRIDLCARRHATVTQFTEIDTLFRPAKISNGPDYHVCNSASAALNYPSSASKNLKETDENKTNRGLPVVLILFSMFSLATSSIYCNKKISKCDDFLLWQNRSYRQHYMVYDEKV